MIPVRTYVRGYLYESVTIFKRDQSAVLVKEDRFAQSGKTVTSNIIYYKPYLKYLQVCILYTKNFTKIWEQFFKNCFLKKTYLSIPIKVRAGAQWDK